MIVDSESERLLLATIAARGSTPLERLLWQEEALNIDLSALNVQSRLQRLYTLVGADNEAAQTHWLTQHNLDPTQLATMLSSPTPESLTLLPPWIQTLHLILTVYAVGSDSEEALPTPNRCLFADEPIPFEELLLPFVEYASQQLTHLTHEHSSLLTEKAHASLEHWLLSELSQLARQPLLVEFKRFRTQWKTPLKITTQANKATRHIYSAFVEQHQDKNLLLFLQKYSTLARLLILRVEQWIVTCQEVLQHLAKDRAEIVQLFNSGQAIELVTEIIPCSESHHDGRTVFILTFDQTTRLVYKPRCMDVDRAFFDLITWFNRSGELLTFQCASVLSRATYGWMEYVAHAPCQTVQEVHRYYQRTGMLLCLCYLLGSTDIHYENLVASGEHPMIIDLETIISPALFDPSVRVVYTDPLIEHHASIEYSVLRSGLLPGFLVGQTDKTIEASGLGPVTQQQTSISLWININTDAMSLHQKTIHLSYKANAVLFNGEVVTPANYQEEIITGFRAMYQFLLDHRRELLSPQGPLTHFTDCPIRLVFRPTNIYWKLLMRLAHPNFLQDWANYWIEMQVFQRPLLRENAPQAHWQIINAEQLALERRDVPFFTTTPTSRDLTPDIGEVVKDVFLRPALDEIFASIALLSKEDMQRQINLIRSAFLNLHSLDTPEVKISPTNDASEKLEALLAPEELVEVACEIAQELERQALRMIDGSASWIAFCYDETRNHYSLRAPGNGLYEGTSGIALFLTTLAQITKDEHYRKLAAATLYPLFQSLRDAYSSLTTFGWKRADIGGTSGLGAFVYGLVHSGQWGHQPGWLEGARQAASLITEKQVSADQRFDVQSGSAGAILGLLALEKISGEKQILERAILCGHHLLKNRVKTESGMQTWSNLQRQKPLIGFLQGTTGIAYALLRLYEVTGIKAFKDAALEAIIYEQQFLSFEAGNVDVQALHVAAKNDTVFRASWHNGATGIGLARLRGLSVLDTPAMRHDIEVALAITQAYPWYSPDNLCYGNFGCLELLLVASQRLQQPNLLETARQRAAILIKRARETGSFHLLHNLPRAAYNPGLFVGSAGVGYELLRLAYPERVPSILLWE